MMYASPLNSLIESLVESIQSDAAALRERHVLRQALYGLVRQAQVEQLARSHVPALGVGRLNGLGHEAPQQARRYQ